jgi:tRNA(Ile)-lysidine synthase
MVGSRKSKPGSRSAGGDLAARVLAALRGTVRRGDRLLLGLSGGADSVALLDVLARCRGRLGVELGALHVNHQLSPNAGRWAAFCRRLCRERGVPLRVTKVEVARGNSLEGAARRARYAALLAAPADFVVLAHNEDDQAETLLLNLLRGAGVRGLAAMPAARGRLLRPLLAVPRADIEDYARRRGLRWIEDESNTDTRFLRNFLRRELLPRLAVRAPAYRGAFARAARHAAEAAALLEELALLDGAGAQALPLAALRRLPRLRAKNALLAFLARAGVEVPAAERVEEALRQALAARGDARVRIAMGAAELRLHAGALHLVKPLPPAPAPLERRWRGERRIALPQLGGVLDMKPARGAGLSRARLSAGPVLIRARRGGERLRPDARRPRRSLKNLLQESRLPPWQRERLPLIYCGDKLACVPGIGVDCEFQARAGEPALAPRWCTRA